MAIWNDNFSFVVTKHMNCSSKNLSQWQSFACLFLKTKQKTTKTKQGKTNRQRNKQETK